MKQVRTDRAIILRNETCVYCRCSLDSSLKSREHVIGRNFVPKGKLEAQWNLIVNACKPCNCRKSDLEDDISTISMQADVWGQYPNPTLGVESIRRAQKSISRRTKKHVKDSSENQQISGKFGSNLEMQIGFTGPPQVDRVRVFELARFQITAFFYWLTFDPVRSRGIECPGAFIPVTYGLRSDWGNSLYIGFMAAVRNWEQGLVKITADGFFKVAIRKHPCAFCWSWSLEWNRNYRVIGFLGDQSTAESLIRAFSAPEMHMIGRSSEGYLRFREEVSLNQDADLLFSEDLESR